MFRKLLQSSLIRSSGIYTITSLLNASLPFLFIPILTDRLSPSDYGIIAMFTLVVNIISPLMGVSSQGAVNRRFFENKVNFSRYVGNSFILLFISLIFFSLLFLLFNGLISGYTSIPGVWLYAVLFIALAQFITLILLTIWQAMIKPFSYGVLQICQTVLNFSLSIFFIYKMDLGWQGRVIGQLLAVCLIGLMSLLILLKSGLLHIKFNLSDLKDILNFSLPLIPHTLGSLLIAFTDRILITNILGVDDTGVYTVAYQIGSVLGIVNSSFVNAYVPWLYKNLDLNCIGAKVKIVKFTYWYFLSLVVLALLCVSFIPSIISYLTPKEYLGATKYLIWIILGYVFNGMYLLVAGFIFYVKKTFWLSRITVFTSMLNIPLCYYLLKYYGTVGAAFSMSIIYCLSFILTWIVSNNVYKMPWFNFRVNNEANNTNI